MIYLWGLQIAIDLFLFTLLVYGMRQLKRVPAEKGANVVASLDTARLKAEQREDEFRELRERMESQLRKLNRICMEAKTILSRASQLTAYGVPSLEECELKSLMKDSENSKNRTIPTLSDVEKTKERLRSEAACDIKTLLQEQLA